MTVKQDIKMFLDNLSVRDKVEVLKELYKDIAGLGVEGDTQLAHINTFEANLLVKCGGSGTLHPVTGLPQYKGGGGGTPQAVFQSTNQSSRLPEEVAPFAEDVLTEAQDYYRMIMNQGYDPYTGAVIAPQTAEQEEAQAGLAALGRGAQGTALQQEALDLQRQQAQKFTPEVAQEYMSPYQRAVTDIEKRQAVEDFQRNVMPQFEAQAVGAGGMSGLGTRAGVQAGILGENLQRRLGDIEAKGLQSAFLNAQQQFQNQKQREAAQAQNIANLGPAMFSQGLAQQGALQSVGEQKQRLGQQALDEQYFKFLEQKAFPEEQLAKYAGFVYGNPLLSQRDVSTTASEPGAQRPSTGQQLLGTGLTAAAAFKQMAPQTFNTFTTGVGNALGNIFSRKGGGGLSDVIYRQEEGQVQPSLADRVRDAKEKVAQAEAAKEAAQRGGASQSDSQAIRESIVRSAISPSPINVPEKKKEEVEAKKEQDSKVKKDKTQDKKQTSEPVANVFTTPPAPVVTATAPAEKDYEVDRVATMLMALGESLLASKPGDPRDPESVRGSTLLRIADGLREGVVDIEDAKKTLKAYELKEAAIAARAASVIDPQKRAAEITAGIKNYVSNSQYSKKRYGEISAKINAIAARLALQYPTADSQLILSLAINEFNSKEGTPADREVNVAGGKPNVKATPNPNSALARQAEAVKKKAAST